MNTRIASPTGLSSNEARRRTGEFGPNAIIEQTVQAWRVYLTKFWGPVAWLLETAIFFQIGLGQYIEASVVSGLLIFNATLGFIQESRATAALAALKKRLAPTALVLRDGEWTKLPAEVLVPGDAIRLSLGALVPADARILSGSVTIDQSMLTGESIPVDADPEAQVFTGSLIRRGQAIAEVTATGAKTYFGHTAELVRIAHSASTEQAAIFGVTRNLAIVNGTVAMLVIGYAYAIALPATDLVRLALTALLASIPIALPATFTLSAAFAAQTLARRGVLLTRLSAAHEAAAMDVLCADKTGTLTHNVLEVVEVCPLPGIDRGHVLALAALASSEADQDPIDTAIRAAAAKAANRGVIQRVLRFIPFDPVTKTSEASVVDSDGAEIRIIKGAFEVIARLAETPADAWHLVDDLAGQGHRVIAVAMGPAMSLRLAGLIAISDSPREDSKALIATLQNMGVRTIMVTGDSPLTAVAIASKVGITGGLCLQERISNDQSVDEFGVFARIIPEEKYRLVKALQSDGHIVGMCGDGTNDAPALKQAQIGIAVSSATDVAKAAASMIITEPGLAGIVFAVREGRIAFQRLLAFTLNMLAKKIEIVLFLAIGLAMTGHAVLTPTFMVLMMVTNDFLAMSLTTDRASPAPTPSKWRMRHITAVGVILGACKLGFSTAVLAFGKFWLGLNTEELQTLAFVTIVFGSQALLYVVRERRRIWSSRPGNWVLAASTADIIIVSLLAISGTLMEPLPWQVLTAVFAATAGFALILDQVKLPVQAAFKVS